MNKLLYKLKDVAKKMWFRCCLFCSFALFSFFLGSSLGEYVPDNLRKIVTTDGVSDILTILASSMLAVTTFSLSIMVQAFGAAATTATPRANKLLMEDSTAQNALGSFIGAFLFSIIGIIGINANIYNQDAIIILFIFTVAMIAVITIMLLRWIDQLSRLGRVTVTIDLVEQALKDSIEERAKKPFLYAQEMTKTAKELEKNYHPVICDEIGYVQYIDSEKLHQLSCKYELDIYITVNPGKFVDSIEPIAFSSKKLDQELSDKLCDSMIIGGDRTFSQDPRYGFVILSEIALRALSPATNDLGTAIDVLGTYVRSVSFWASSFKSMAEQKKLSPSRKVKYKRVYIPRIEEKDILEDMFGALIADASKHLVVSIRLKKSLLSIQSLKQPEFSHVVDYWLERLELFCKEHFNEADMQKMNRIS